MSNQLADKTKSLENVKTYLNCKVAEEIMNINDKLYDPDEFKRMCLDTIDTKIHIKEMGISSKFNKETADLKSTMTHEFDEKEPKLYTKIK